MPSSPTEIRDIVDEVEQPFLASSTEGGLNVRDRMKTQEDVVWTRYDYTKELSPLLSQKIGVAADVLRSYLLQIKGALQSDITLHLDPVGDLQRQETAADRMEVMEAYELMRLDSLGNLRDMLHHYQSVGLFFAAWLEQDPWMEVAQGKGESSGDWAERNRVARSGWFPFKLTGLNPHTVAFQEHDRKVTISTRRFQLPIIDLLERYSGSYKVTRGNTEGAMKFMGEHYGWLRGGEEQSIWTDRDLSRRTAEILVVDDGNRICHYVDLKGDGVDKNRVRLAGVSDDNRYKGVGEVDYKNTFGQNSLLLAEGVYNPYQPLAWRREGLLQPLISILHSKARIKSHFASRAASPPLVQDVPPPEVSLWLAQHPNEPRPEAMPLTLQIDQNGRPTAFRPLGELKELTLEVEAPLRELLSIFDTEEQVASPRGLILSDEAADAVGSIVLGQLDEKNRELGPTQKSEINLWSNVLDMLRHAQQHDLNSHRTKGDKETSGDWPFAFTTTGQEWAVKGQVVKRGSKIVIKPQDYDIDYTRTMEPVDNRYSTQQARRQTARERRQDGTILWDEYMQLNGVENVSEFNEKLTEEQLFQLNVPSMVAETRLKVAEYTALITGQDLMEVQAKMAMLPNLESTVQGALTPGAVDAPNPYQMASPSLEPTGTNSATTSVSQ